METHETLEVFNLIQTRATILRKTYSKLQFELTTKIDFSEYYFVAKNDDTNFAICIVDPEIISIRYGIRCPAEFPVFSRSGVFASEDVMWGRVYIARLQYMAAIDAWWTCEENIYNYLLEQIAKNKQRTWELEEIATNIKKTKITTGRFERINEGLI